MIIGRTTRGLEQRVILAEPGIFAWLSAYACYPRKLDERVCLELHKNNKPMGRLAIRDEEVTIGAGHIEEFIY